MYWNVLKLKNTEKQQSSRQKLSGQHKINIDNEFRNYYTQICDLKLYINIQYKCRLNLKSQKFNYIGIQVQNIRT